MQRFAWVLLALVLGAAAITIVATSSALPATVASHFDGRGAPNGWMTRGFYTVFMLAFALGLPLLIVAIMAGTARIAPGKMNVPNCSYWRAPEHRAEAIGKLTALACWLAAFIAAFVVGMHFLLMAANLGTAPHLPNPAFFALLSSFVFGLLVWIVMMYVQFRRPGK